MKDALTRYGAPLLAIALVGGLTACNRAYDPALHTEMRVNTEFDFAPVGTSEVREFAPGQTLRTQPVYNKEQHAATIRALKAMNLGQPNNYYVDRFGDAGLAVEDVTQLKDGFLYSLRHPESNIIYRVTLLTKVFPGRTSDIVVEAFQPVEMGGQAQAIDQAISASNLADEPGVSEGFLSEQVLKEVSRYGEVVGYQNLGHQTYIWVKTSPARQVRLVVDRSVESDEIKNVRVINEYERFSRFFMS